MTRYAIDAGIMLNAMAGYDPEDPTSLDEPLPQFGGHLNKDLSGITIGFDEQYCFTDVTPDTVEIIKEACEVLTSLGAKLVPCKMPIEADFLYHSWEKLVGAETAIVHESFYPKYKDQYGPVFRQILELGHSTSGIDMMKIYHERLKFTGSLNKVFHEVDVMILPVHPNGNPKLADMERLFKSGGMLRFTSPMDMSGNPTITLNGGFNGNNMPIGFQIAGPNLSEAQLIKIGYAYQQVTSWHEQHPSLD